MNAASQVVSIGRCLLWLVWNHLSLGTKGAVKLVPHKRLLISTGELSKIIHTCNTLRDATVVGLWSVKYKAYENATYMYLGGGTEYHPPYVYSLVFRDVSFEIAYSLAVIVLALSEGYVDGDLSTLFMRRSACRQKKAPILQRNGNDTRVKYKKC